MNNKFKSVTGNGIANEKEAYDFLEALARIEDGHKDLEILYKMARHNENPCSNIHRPLSLETLERIRFIALCENNITPGYAGIVKDCIHKINGKYCLDFSNPQYQYLIKKYSPKSKIEEPQTPPVPL